MTTWRGAPGFPAYEVSDAGGVRNRATRKTLRGQLNDKGYRKVHLSADGRLVWRTVHSLVLETFVGPRPSARHHGAHGPDRRRTNNRVDNLRWALPEENEADKAAHGTKLGGGLKAPTPIAAVREIFARVESGESFSRIACALKMHRTSVARIARGLRRRAA